MDLTLFDMNTDKEVDTEGTFNYFGEGSYPDYKEINDEQFNLKINITIII